MTSASHPSADHRLGAMLANALASIENLTPQMRQAVLLDLLGDDRSLWPALRQLIEHPGFDTLRSHPSRGARQAGRDAWLQELATWCNQESLARAGEFLDGLLNLGIDEVMECGVMGGTHGSGQESHEMTMNNQSIKNRHDMDSIVSRLASHDAQHESLGQTNSTAVSAQSAKYNVQLQYAKQPLFGKIRRLPGVNYVGARLPNCRRARRRTANIAFIISACLAGALWIKLSWPGWFVFGGLLLLSWIYSLLGKH